MALGKNLKKRKLISEESSETQSKRKAPTKKKVTQKKSELINKPKTKKPKAVPIKSPAEKDITTKKQEKVDKTSEQQKVSESINAGLPMFIAQEIHEKKSKLRKKYEQDIERLKNETVQFVVIEIGGESYAIDIDVVKEIVPIPSLSKTPNTPMHISGIANVRGNTYVVYDLANKFKVIGDEFAKFLLLLDNISASLVLSVLPTTFKTTGPKISNDLKMIEDASLDISYIKGIIQENEKIIYYLDVIELLKNDKAIVVPDNLMTESNE